MKLDHHLFHHIIHYLRETDEIFICLRKIIMGIRLLVHLPLLSDNAMGWAVSISHWIIKNVLRNQPPRGTASMI